MGKVISVRINKWLEDVINKFSQEEHQEQSDIIRELIKNGSIYLAIKGYAKGKYSIGKAADLAHIPLSEFMDLVSDLGIISKIGVDDVLEGYENLKKFSD
ncbi:MAG: UPF0175 family protein [Candidatus Helarchaeota archaeon]